MKFCLFWVIVCIAVALLPPHLPHYMDVVMVIGATGWGFNLGIAVAARGH